MIRSRFRLTVLFAILSPILPGCDGTSPTSVPAAAVAEYDPSIALSRPRPAACPTRATETVSGTIGPAGGTLLLSSGHRLDVPAGALPTPTLFTLTAPAGPMLVVTVTARGTEPSRISATAALTISYERCKRQKLVPVSARVSPVSAKMNVAADILPGETDRRGETISFDVDLSSDGEGIFVARSTYAVAY